MLILNSGKFREYSAAFSCCAVSVEVLVVVVYKFLLKDLFELTADFRDSVRVKLYSIL